MRVLYFTDTYPPQVNGVSVVTHLSVAGLADRGWDVGVVAPRYPPGTDVFAGALDRVVLSLPSLATPGYPDVRLAAPLLGRAWRAAARFDPDLIHCATEGVVGWLGQRVARRLGRPLATSYHTDFGRYLASYRAAWLRTPVTDYLTRFHARARVTCTPSRVTQTELLDRGIRHVLVWGSGVDSERFHPRHRCDRWREAAGDGQFIFLHVGRLAPEKGVDRLLTAFGRCRAELGDRVGLIVAGDGPSRTALERSAPPGVRFLGYLDRRAELPSLYASADAFVFASETETLGLVVLEAMASGLPVVAVAAGGVQDHLRHGVNGLAVRPGAVDQMAGFMVELATLRPLHQSLAAGARETALALGWDRELDRLDLCYRDLCALDWRSRWVDTVDGEVLSRAR
jgi:glycosyltransferase involved in cell wall biosynthesis